MKDLTILRSADLKLSCCDVVRVITFLPPVLHEVETVTFSFTPDWSGVLGTSQSQVISNAAGTAVSGAWLLAGVQQANQEARTGIWATTHVDQGCRRAVGCHPRLRLVVVQRTVKVIGLLGWHVSISVPPLFLSASGIADFILHASPSLLPDLQHSLLGRLTHRLVPARCLPSDVLYHWPVHLVSNGITEKRGATSVTHPPGRLNRPASWNRAEGSPINGNWPQTTCVPCSRYAGSLPCSIEVPG